MKQNQYITYLVAMFIMLSFYACKDEFDMTKINEPQKLSVSCYPSTADTTWIWVSRTIPISQYSNAEQDMSISNAHIIYKVNGQQREVSKASSGLYYVCGTQNVGDKITIDVTADGFGTVKSEATVPNAIPINNDLWPSISFVNLTIVAETGFVLASARMSNFGKRIVLNGKSDGLSSMKKTSALTSENSFCQRRR